MPLNLPAADEPAEIEKGALYVVATPIGNFEDITLRALKVLGGVDMVAAEDTRHTGRMLSRYRIASPLISCHDYNEADRALQFIQKLREGAAIAIVTDAGTPSVSDPGYRLVCMAIQAGIKVIPVPGVSAAICALSVAGLPTDAFVFLGFPPKKPSRRTDLLHEIKTDTRTLIFYESPKRIITFLQDVRTVLGDRRAVVCREMTKRFEEFIRGSVSEILTDLSARREIKGECTVLLSGTDKIKPVSAETLESVVSGHLRDSLGSPSSLARKMATQYGISRKDAYRMILTEKEKGGPLEK